MSSDAYAAQLTALLPQGRLWRLLNSIWQSFLLGLGDTLAATDSDIGQLLVEADPRTCSVQLPNWEAATGLPDDCIPNGGSVSQRRNAVVARLVSTGGADAAYFIALAATYGYTITITETATNSWKVNCAAATVLVNATCNGTCDDPLETFGNQQLECLITRVKPAHTLVSFAYGS